MDKLFPWFAKDHDPVPLTFRFLPEDDITVQELAHVVSRLGGAGPPRHGVRFTQEQWADLPQNIKRHFK